jgi:hypothetical protein
VPSFLIEPNELASNLCGLLGHVKNLHNRGHPHSAGDNINIMAYQRAYLIFGDIEGKLDVLRASALSAVAEACTIEKHGRKANLMKWKEQLNGDCPRRDAHSLQERCDLICPDLPKVL